MHIVIMGCGRVGSTLAHILEDRGNSIAIIDRDPEAFRRLGSSFKGDKITGIGFDRAVLTQAGTERADAFAAVSSGDNSNILSARVAREVFGVERVAARIYDPRRAEVYERLGIPTVATVRWTADQMLRKLLPEGGEPLWRDPTGKIVLAEVAFAPRWIGEQPFGPLHALDRDRLGVTVDEQHLVPVLQQFAGDGAADRPGPSYRDPHQ